MSEQAMWEYLRPKLVSARVTVERFTDKLREGVADTGYAFPDGTFGWCELKYLAKLPTGGSFLIPWTSPSQPLFLNRWARSRVRAGVLLRVGAGDTWAYWRARPDLGWLGEVQSAVTLGSATWTCGGRLHLPGLLDALHRDL